MDPFHGYLDTFERLRSRKTWSSDTTVLRFAALALGQVDAPDLYQRLEAAASELRRRAGWFGPMRSPVRYIVAAILLRRELDPGRIHDQVVRARELFRERRMKRGGVRESMAALLLILLNDGRDVTGHDVDRIREILRWWKEDHRWLTGIGDYPMAAYHAARQEDPRLLGTRIERLYQGLWKAGFKKGDQLQLASHILAARQWGYAEAVESFAATVRAFESRGEKIRQSRYDEAALLALTSGDPETLAELVVQGVGVLRDRKPRPPKEIAFSIATSIVLSSESASNPEMEAARDLTALTTLQSILDAQAAVLAATAAASSAATGAS